MNDPIASTYFAYMAGDKVVVCLFNNKLNVKLLHNGYTYITFGLRPKK